LRLGHDRHQQCSQKRKREGAGGHAARHDDRAFRIATIWQQFGVAMMTKLGWPVD
jgi:hypothetical protein